MPSSSLLVEPLFLRDVVDFPFPREEAEDALGPVAFQQGYRLELDPNGAVAPGWRHVAPFEKGAIHPIAVLILGTQRILRDRAGEAAGRAPFSQVDGVRPPRALLAGEEGEIIFETKRLGERALAILARLFIEIELPAQVRSDRYVAHFRRRAVVAERTEGEHRKWQRLIPVAAANGVGSILPEDARAIDVIQCDQFPGDLVRRTIGRKLTVFELEPCQLLVASIGAESLRK